MVILADQYIGSAWARNEKKKIGEKKNECKQYTRKIYLFTDQKTTTKKLQRIIKWKKICTELVHIEADCLNYWEHKHF